MTLTLRPVLRYVAYYRVSTAQQGHSGLGLEAQREAVRLFLDASGGTLTEAFTEIESGKHAARPQLARALDVCRLTGAVLVSPSSTGCPATPTSCSDWRRPGWNSSPPTCRMPTASPCG